MLCAIDPGINGCGFAIFDQHTGTLRRAAYVPNPVGKDAKLRQRVQGMGDRLYDLIPEDCETLVSECPQVYRGSINATAALLPLAEVCAYVAGGGKQAEWLTYYPREWKGNIDADAMTERIKSRLMDTELARIDQCTPGLLHNVFDACGLGLHFFGRLAPRKVYAR